MKKIEINVNNKDLKKFLEILQSDDFQILLYDNGFVLISDFENEIRLYRIEE